MPATLAIDPGCATGIAFCRRDGTIAHRTWRLRCLAGGRLVELHQLLCLIHEAERFERVSYETPYGGRNFAAVRVLVQFEAIITYWAASVGLPCLGFTPPEIKRSVASGKASKAKMIERVRWLGFNPANDHEADAIALLRLVQSGAQPQQQMRREAAVVSKRQADEFDLFAVTRRARPRKRVVA